MKEVVDNLIFERIDFDSTEIGTTIYHMNDDFPKSVTQVVVTDKRIDENSNPIVHTINPYTKEIVSNHPSRFIKGTPTIILKPEQVNNQDEQKQIKHTHCWCCKREKLSSDIDKMHDKSKCSWRDDCIVCPKCGAAGCENPKYKRN